MVLEESSGETDQDRCSAIIEADNPLRWITEVGDDEAHSGEKFSLVPLYLGHLPPGPVPTLGLVSKVVLHTTGSLDGHSTECSIRCSICFTNTSLEGSRMASPMHSPSRYSYTSGLAKAASARNRSRIPFYWWRSTTEYSRRKAEYVCP